MLEEGQISKLIIDRMNKIKSLEVIDIDEAIREEANSVEQYVFEAIKNITIVIPIGAIKIDPNTGANTNVIELNNVVK